MVQALLPMYFRRQAGFRHRSVSTLLYCCYCCSCCPGEKNNILTIGVPAGLLGTVMRLLTLS